MKALQMNLAVFWMVAPFALTLAFSPISIHSRSPFVLPILANNNPSTCFGRNTYSGLVVVAKPPPQLQHTTRQHRHVLFMGWGPDPVWSTAKVTSNSPACESAKSVLLTVEVPAETAAEYKVPGQYVQVRLNEQTKPLFLAVASPPNSENAVLEFLVKKTDGNEWMTGISAGAAIQVSQVLGQGYALQENLDSLKFDFPTQNVLLFAAGSGIAPIKAAVESRQLQTDISRTCRLYYGERTAADLCFVDQFADWEQIGVEVVPVLSQPTDDWQGRSGYIQTALEEDGVAVPRNTGALICGMKGMAEATKELLTSAGVFEGRVLFNF